MRRTVLEFKYEGWLPCRRRPEQKQKGKPKERQLHNALFTPYVFEIGFVFEEAAPSRLYVCFSDVQCGVYALQILP